MHVTFSVILVISLQTQSFTSSLLCTSSHSLLPLHQQKTLKQLRTNYNESYHQCHLPYLSNLMPPPTQHGKNKPLKTEEAHSFLKRQTFSTKLCCLYNSNNMTHRSCKCICLVQCPLPLSLPFTPSSPLSMRGWLVSCPPYNCTHPGSCLFFDYISHLSRSQQLELPSSFDDTDRLLFALPHTSFT